MSEFQNIDLAKVNAQNNRNKMMPKTQSEDYKKEVQEQVDAINNIARLLDDLNKKTANILYNQGR